MQSAIPIFFDMLRTSEIHANVHEIIPKAQHGFVKKHSTASNLLEITQFIHDNIRSTNKINVVYFDFSKAFDRVDHHLLACKLAKLSMPFILFKTIVNFITNRKYYIIVDGQIQKEFFIALSSVPHGSHCGPLLYLIFCFDIVECVADTGVKLLQYADDTKFKKIVNNVTDRNNLRIQTNCD